MLAVRAQRANRFNVSLLFSAENRLNSFRASLNAMKASISPSSVPPIARSGPFASSSALRIASLSSRVSSAIVFRIPPRIREKYHHPLFLIESLYRYHAV